MNKRALLVVEKRVGSDDWHPVWSFDIEKPESCELEACHQRSLGKEVRIVRYVPEAQER